MPVRRYLALMLGAVSVPILALAVLVAWRFVQAERARFEAGIAASAQVVQAVMDREAAGLVGILKALATSPLLAQGDVAGFHRQASELAAFAGLDVSLRDREGRLAASTLVPWGQPLPQRSSVAPWDEEALAAGGAVLTGHFVGRVSGLHYFGVVAPVAPGLPLAPPRMAEPGAAARWLLHLSVPTTRLAEALAGLGLEQDTIAVVLDRGGDVLARLPDHPGAVGTRSTLVGRLPDPGQATSGRMTSRSGPEVFFVARRSAATGLVAVAAAPTAALQARLRAAWLALAATAALLLGLSVAAARLFSRPLARALRRLAARGAALGRGEPVTGLGSPVREVVQVADALAAAAAELRAREARRLEADHDRDLLLRELDHRVKNLLATVLALAELTAREEGDVAAFRRRLADRVRGLARTHDLLRAGGGAQVGLAELLRAELGMHDRAGGGRILLDGPAVTLPSATATALGMVVHELATNAAKYGALSTPGGQVEIRWALEGAAPAARLELRWRERGGPPVAVPARPGFGTRLIERGLARQLGATVATDYAPEGVRVRLSMPAPPSAAPSPPPLPQAASAPPAG